MHFGATLRLLRVEAGLSLRELAGLIGVSGTYLSRVENGHDPSPTPDRLIAIADVLGISRAVLVELASQAGPAVEGYLRRVPEAGALFLEIARRGLRGPQIARIKAFMDAELPMPDAAATPRSMRRLTDLLPTERIVVGVSCSDLEDLVSVAVTRLGDDVDARLVAERILARERELPTLLGGGFVAPHAIVEGSVDAAVLITLKQPLPVRAPDAQPVRVAFVLVGGPDGRARLEIFTRVARLAGYDVADELCAAATPEQARSIVERVESLW
jgi:PTS system nitrogen regulatory IIA component